MFKCIEADNDCDDVDVDIDSDDDDYGSLVYFRDENRAVSFNDVRDVLILLMLCMCCYETTTKIASTAVKTKRTFCFCLDNAYREKEYFVVYYRRSVVCY